MKYTIKNFKAQFPDDAACLRFLFVTRYGKNGGSDQGNINV